MGCQQSFIKGFLRRWFICFLVLGIVFIPFRFVGTTLQLETTQLVFGKLMSFLTNGMGFRPLLTDFSSDSIYLYGLVACLAVIAFVFSVGIYWGSFYIFFDKRIVPWCFVVFRYYLALLLFKYGVDKLVKSQFYLPEPNLLFAPMGKLDKDILFWSTMGVSRAYSLFMGMMEVIPAILLLFRRTTLLGSILAVGVLLHVVAINFSFDISVKVFSFFLLLLSLAVLSPYLKSLLVLFFGKGQVVAEENSARLRRKGWVKAFVVVLVLGESVGPYIVRNNFNDDTAPRPFLHGAYSLDNNRLNYKNLFIHRDGYLIFQTMDDEFIDVKVSINPLTNEMRLTNYDLQTVVWRYTFDAPKKKLSLTTGNGEILIGTSVDWRKLPLLRNQFHWTVD
jgi:hypothetical protein